MASIDLFAGLLASTLRLATPLLLAGMAGLLSYQVGLINIALEGFMLVGAFIAVAVAAYFGAAWTGVLAAALAGAAFAALFALFVTDFKGDLIVTGLAMNFLILGGTAYLLQVIYNTSGTIAPEGLQKLPVLTIPVLSDLPFLGPVLFSHSPLVYLSWLMVPVTSIFLYHVVSGVHIRAVGEDMEAAATAGISVRRMQYLALMLGGILCGLAGANLSIGDLSLFRENMTNGRGFIALAAVYFAAGRPQMTAVACLLFGLFDALQFRLQTISNIPPQIFQMLPYLMVVLMLVIIAIPKEWKKGW
ncbi:MAG: ABC transporter permease [Candidatus Promineifilaceae bacterium]|nr:ABC transporter permease [Candidatus Promineifilaceae bacterium]